MWFFTPGVDGSLLFGGSGSEPYGSGFDEDVTYGDINDAVRDYKLIVAGVNSVSPSYVSTPDEYQMFILIAAPLKAAEKLNIKATDREVVSFISKIAYFQDEKGAFSSAKYNDYAEKALARTGLTTADFEKAVRNFLTIAKLGIYDVSALAQIFNFNNQYALMMELASLRNVNVTVTGDEVMKGAVTFLEKYKTRGVSFKINDFISRVAVTPEAIREFYDKNPNAFMTEPVSDSVAASAKASDFAPDAVTDEQLAKEYEAAKTSESYSKMSEAEAKKALKKAIEERSSMSKAFKAYYAFASELTNLTSTEAFKTDPGKVFSEAALKAGLKLETIKGLTRQSLDPEAVKNDPAVKKFENNENLLRATLALPAPGSVSEAVFLDNAVGLVVLTRRTQSEMMEFSVAAAKAENLFKRSRAFELAGNAAREFRSKLEGVPSAAEALADTAKAIGGTLEDVPEFSLFTSSENTDQRQQIFHLLAANTETGKLSKEFPYASEVLCVFVDSRTPPAPEDVKKSEKEIRSALENQKYNLEMQAYTKWISDNIKILVKDDKNQPEQSAQ